MTDETQITEAPMMPMEEDLLAEATAREAVAPPRPRAPRTAAWDEAADALRELGDELAEWQQKLDEEERKLRQQGIRISSAFKPHVEAALSRLRES